MTFRVGIIGCGRMANTIEDEQISRREARPYRGGLVLPYSHAASYAVVEETEVVAACDIEEGKLNAFAERWGISACYTDYREMIEKEQLDIVTVATRPQQHAEQMIFAANQGIKGVYAEKPLCMTLEETDAICEAFERNGTHLEYGPIYRHWTAYEQARTIAESNELGAVRSVLGFEGKALEGHFIDLLLYLLGDPKPVSIAGMISELRPIGADSEMQFDDTPLAWAHIEFDNGTTAHVTRTGVGREAEVVCTDGTIRVFNDGDAIQVRRRAPASGALDIVDVAQFEPWSGTVRMIQDLVRMIQTGEPGRSNLEVTLTSQEIGFGLYESHLQGGVAVSPPIPRRGLWVSSW